jgi:superfamily I DNA/RNA helicase
MKTFEEFYRAGEFEKLANRSIGTTFTRKAAAREMREVMIKNLNLSGVPNTMHTLRLIGLNMTIAGSGL